MIKKFVSPILMIALVMMTSITLLNPREAMAASITVASDTLSRLKASTASDHTIVFNTPTGIANSATVTLTFNNGTSTAGVVLADVDVLVEATPITLNAGAPGATEWQFANATPVITFTLGSGAAVTAGDTITIKIGTNASGTHQITNGSAGATTLTINGTMADSGAISMYIIDDDQVTITASVNQTLFFDLDTAEDFHDGEDVAPYSVELGVLSATSITHSDDSSIKMIVAEGGTNASGGMNVTVKNANGVDGLVSTSNTDDTIPSDSARMVVGTANYGLCVVPGGQLEEFARATGYVDDDCAFTGVTENEVQGLLTTPTDILTSAAPVTSGHAEIIVNAEISGSTPAHTDYTDTLTFIATASY